MAPLLPPLLPQLLLLLPPPPLPPLLLPLLPPLLPLLLHLHSARRDTRDVLEGLPIRHVTTACGRYDEAFAFSSTFCLVYYFSFVDILSFNRLLSPAPVLMCVAKTETTSFVLLPAPLLPPLPPPLPPTAPPLLPPLLPPLQPPLPGASMAVTDVVLLLPNSNNALTTFGNASLFFSFPSVLFFVFVSLSLSSPFLLSFLTFCTGTHKAAQPLPPATPMVLLLVAGKSWERTKEGSSLHFFQSIGTRKRYRLEIFFLFFLII